MVAVAPDYNRWIPKEQTQNLRWRSLVCDRMQSDSRFAAAIRQACSEDILFWVNGFIWTYDPRRKPHSKIPMISYPFQDRAILKLRKSILDGTDILIEKSRDMGASWICLLVFLWFWIYRPLQSFLIGSRVAEYVDKKGNPKSLFWKLDFALSNMPTGLCPTFVRLKYHLLNAENGSVIDGEATTEDFARGDRRTAILLDEFAAVDDGYSIWTATRDATDCRIVNSTHKGTGTGYYAVSITDIDKLRLHWSEHPLKAIGLYTRVGGELRFLDEAFWSGIEAPMDLAEELDSQIVARGVTLEDGKQRSPWYALQCKRAAHAVEISQELDIDCLGSSYQFFAATKIAAYVAKHCRPPFLVGDLEYDHQTLEPIGFREDPKGPMRLWLRLDGRGFPVIRDVVLGCDVSAGTGASNSALSGISQTSLEKVLEYANPRIRPEEFGRFTVAVARWLHGAKVIWEQNGPGRQFGDAIIEAGYRAVYFAVDEKKVVKNMTMVPGWQPTRENKLALLGDYRRALELESLINYSELALRDCLEYVFLPNNSVEHSQAQNTPDPTGARSNHGDRAIADALCWKLAKNRPMPKSKHTGSQAAVGSFAWRRNQSRTMAKRKTVWG